MLKRIYLRDHLVFNLFIAVFLLGAMLTVSQSGPALAAERRGLVDLTTAITQVAKQNIPAVVLYRGD